MNFNYDTSPELVGNIDSDVTDEVRMINKLLKGYPRGSGSYSILQVREEGAESLLRDSGLSEESAPYKALLNAIGQLGALVRSEQNVASQQQIKGGQSTQVIEDQKKAQYASERAERNLIPMDKFPALKPAPGEVNMPLILGLTGAAIIGVIALKG